MQTADTELGYLAHPDAGAHPGVVLIHDVWGLYDHYRDLTRRLAGEAFAVLALDLYRREGKVEIEDPGRWMRALSDPQVLSDVQAGVDFLRAHPASADRKVGVTGFCMGGMYALLAGCGLRDVAAVAPFYGLLSHAHGILHAPEGLDPHKKPRQPLDAVVDLACPALAFYGDCDQFVPMADIQALEERLAKTGRSAQVKIYPGAGHAFMNETRPEAHRPAEARDAWERMVGFFREQLAARQGRRPRSETQASEGGPPRS